MHYTRGVCADPSLLRKMFDTFAALKVPSMTPDPYPEPAMKLVLIASPSLMPPSYSFCDTSNDELFIDWW
jgi:hypothetical protein